MSEATPRRTISEEQKAKQAVAMRAAWARRSPEERKDWADKVRTAAAKAGPSSYHKTEQARSNCRKAQAARWAGHVKMTTQEKSLIKELQRCGKTYAEAKREMLRLMEVRNA